MVVTELLSERAEREARRDWWQAAACRTADPDIFFPVSAHGPGELEIAEAKAVCATCPVRRQCLQFALATHQVHGVWGGTTEEERRLHMHTHPVLPVQAQSSRGALTACQGCDCRRRWGGCEFDLTARLAGLRLLWWQSDRARSALSGSAVAGRSGPLRAARPGRTCLLCADHRLCSNPFLADCCHSNARGD